MFWYLFIKAPSFSPKNITFNLTSPERVELGELVRFEIDLTNKNEIPLAWADIIFQYPENAKPTKEEVSKTLRERRKLGIIGPNEEIKEEFEAYIFGEVDKEYEFKATLEFRFEGSNIISEKEKLGKIKVIASPIGLNIEGPNEINSGQALKLKINYLSNSSALFEDLILEAEYPFGFEFKQASPAPAFQNERWLIGDLSRGERRSVILEGILEGGNLEEKYFKIKIGRLVEGEFNIYGEALKKVVVKKGFLEVAILTETKNQTVSAGQIIRGEVRYKNNLPVAVENVRVELEILGRAVNEKSISAFQGYYLGEEKKIVWNQGSYPDLRFLEPGKDGKLDFQFKVLEKLPIYSAEDKNFVISLKAKILTLKPPLNYQEVDLSSELSSSFKVETEYGFTRQGFYYHKEMPNTGPIPPQVGKKTTYTLVFSLLNSSNNIIDLEIRSFLPSYMTWENKILPQETNLEYNEKTQEIVWKISRLEAGTGIVKPVKQVIFQVGLIPSPPQINTSPVILGETFIRGLDEFSQKAIEEKKPALTTELRTDPKLGYGDWRVVE